jgi:hypothetical protein
MGMGFNEITGEALLEAQDLLEIARVSADAADAC